MAQKTYYCPECGQSQTADDQAESFFCSKCQKTFTLPKTSGNKPPVVKSKRTGGIIKPILTTLLILIAAILLVLCKIEKKWDYKVVVFYGEGYSRTGRDAGKSDTIKLPEKSLDKLGENGWELVTSCSEEETAFPNFGSEEYVLGIQPNIRPQKLTLIFKRPYLKFSIRGIEDFSPTL